MDFVKDLSCSMGNGTIFVVVDWLRKYPLSHPFSAKSIAILFAKEVVRLHEFPQSVVLDRNKVFISHVGLRLPGAEFWYDTSFHNSLETTPFHVVYRCTPLPLLSYGDLKTANAMLDQLTNCNEALEALKEQLRLAQEQMNKFTDRHHCEVEFDVGNLSQIKALSTTISSPKEQRKTLSWVLWALWSTKTVWTSCL